ncbi:Pentatricopeptide repeat (PPR) superfamily protein [Hibiscus syriacus]|uniref:Reticulon-like protein n=1 Tax=Hibiscus syriacus TaxID=106335 RepID=A0A6A3ATF4_HIBSY|nr:reticulon-like protein B13 [Hibiscus syriacus]KAE8707063.1 Pentatricopeptide repeat (PPR) superfamily protein [Hibiscus syriacus]
MNHIINAVPGVALSTVLGQLLESIKNARKTAKRFKPILNQIRDTVNLITPRVEEINRSTDAHEIQRLLNLLNQAKETVDKSSRVSSWNISKKYKFAKELIELDTSIRTTLDVFFPVMIYGDTRKILDSVDELKLMFSIFFYIMLEHLHSGAKNTGGAIFDLIREKIVHSQPSEVVNDIALWKRKKISGSLLVSSTATWLLQQVCQYNFLTIASWVAIFIVTSLFIWRYVNRFLDREEASKSRLENLREQVVMDTANACWEVTDKVIRWIFDATDVEANWSVFPQTVAFLLLFSYVGSFFDLPTLCGVIMTGTTVPVIVAKHGDRIMPFGSMVGKVYEMLVENLTNTMKNNVGKEEIRRKKIKKQY